MSISLNRAVRSNFQQSEKEQNRLKEIRNRKEQQEIVQKQNNIINKGD